MRIFTKIAERKKQQQLEERQRQERERIGYAKICKHCKQLKPLISFSKDKNMKDGLQRWCKRCKTDWKREHYDKDKQAQYYKKRRQHTIEQRQTKIGLVIADMLGLTQTKQGRYYTTWGTKTPLGLCLSIQRIIKENP